MASIGAWTCNFPDTSIGIYNRPTESFAFPSLFPSTRILELDTTASKYPTHVSDDALPSCPARQSRAASLIQGLTKRKPI